MNIYLKILSSKRKLLSIYIFLFFLLQLNDSFAQTTNFSFPVMDQLMCGFISYSKSKLAPYIAVLSVMIGVIGHWLGMSRIWGLLLYVSMGLGLIMGIGSVVTSATGATASCLMN
jgi:hypothetical protein